MKTQLAAKRILGQAQYGNIVLCEVPRGTALTFATANTNFDSNTTPLLHPFALPAHSVDASDGANTFLVVVKQISWRRVWAKQQRIDSDTMQPSDDPTVEIDVAAKICAAGGHKHILQYYAVLKHGRGSKGIAMEYCNEGDLLHRLEQLPENRFCESEALLALQQVTEALRFLHQHVGVAHRDVSLENVMVHDGVCKLGDFGLSTRIYDNQEPRRRRRRLVTGRVGKQGYMAPEVAAGSNAYDPACADIWSLGILFFSMLTGSPLVEMASVDCPAFRAFCRLGLRRVLDDWKMSDLFHEATLDLCDAMLQVDPRNRLSLDEILSHAAFDQLPVLA